MRLQEKGNQLVWQITALRIFTVVFVGILLYGALIFVVGWRDGAGIRKRRKHSWTEQRIRKDKIGLIYLLALTVFIIMGFLYIKFYIRGAK